MTDSTTAGKLDDLASRLADNKESATARGRILSLVDADSFTEIDALARHRVTTHGFDASRPASDGVVAGYATIEGRKVCVFAQDRSIFDGRVGEVHGEKIVKLQQLAAKSGVPLIGFYEGAGPRAVEGVAALSLMTKILSMAGELSGVVPQIAVITGEAAGVEALLPSLADITIMAGDSSSLHLTEPDVIKAVSGQDAAIEDFGASAHMSRSGIAHLYCPDDEQELPALLRELISYLPANNRAEAPRIPGYEVVGSAVDNISPTDVELDSLLPDSTAQPYDVHEVIARLVDASAFFELQHSFAPNVVTGFARIEGRAIGIVANQPSELAGCLSSNAAVKAARFVRTCDAFNIPVITLVDTPGFLPDMNQELGGVIRHTGKLAFAYAGAQVGLVTVVLRRAMGAAYCVMAPKDLGADLVFAWPTAEIATSTATVAVPEIYAKDLAKAQRKGKDTQPIIDRGTQDFDNEVLSPYRAAERGIVDSVIPPSQTRGQLVEALRLLDRKVLRPIDRKHGNLPL